ncbi:MAG: hypothetical protein A2Z64_09715 [Betaproteobacteria bacterium RIFCSPLOWO2_02_67_12]|nr:MAG: hypothetical protein A2Z64_09715 [Betaproteobacteria bacterium RIFCSPLOWO2_02_67_12]OGA28344.1 MAG: hypothetical protein A3I65_10100 [Betaproteobacteria bacterium RIFCSPLOWO2_02_FULL_68_150]OGA71364.1 MAG: hypothetical protein A3F77_10490 [Betaproteobacteria bacterium RIFCSPLOWO2_12_FULL_67_28]
MLWKRIAILTAAGAALGATAPAFADPPHWAPAHGYRAKHYAPRVATVYPRPYVVVAPRPVVAYRAPAYYYSAPAYSYGPPAVPAYRTHGYYAADGALVGAIAGAVIGGSVTHGSDRVAGVAIGSVLGAVVGHELAGGY